MNDIVKTFNQKSSIDMFDMMEKAYKFAEIMAKSDIIPQHYRAKPANVFIAVQTAYRMDLDPMLVMQNTYVVGGKLGMNTTFAISLANNSGLFSNGIRYRQSGEGESLEVTAYTNLKKTNEEISYTFSYKTAVAEGYTRNSKYKTMPELMLRYRAATLLIRTHAPEVLNGMHMIEELEDVEVAREIKDVTPVKHESKTASILSKLNAIHEPKEDALEEPKEHDTLVQEIESPNLYQDLLGLVEKYEVPDELISKWCERAGVSELSDLNDDHLKACIGFIKVRFHVS